MLLAIGIAGIGATVIYRQGLKDGQRMAQGVEIKSATPLVVFAKGKKKNSECVDRERERIEKIYRNIDNYDGTGLGQEVI